MAKIIVRNQTKKTLTKDGVDYICITDIARQKNPIEPKDVVKNWLRSKNTLEYLGLWEQLNNPNFKGGEFAPPQPVREQLFWVYHRGQNRYHDST